MNVITPTINNDKDKIILLQKYLGYNLDKITKIYEICKGKTDYEIHELLIKNATILKLSEYGVACVVGAMGILNAIQEEIVGDISNGTQEQRSI